eukprot:Blabericola_migrator_1__1553@NODE_140_length_13109_cov_183_610106_g122_i0_p1_GENE_NODE_140_length_13109_cov_183_610106_g122_i0NODE_140_length_13109_cov_183_610106_g122_i0_p1_ORF_typecomplete_len1235_score213_80Nop14/PF04147_12/7_3e02Nop14/PF04147_12/0_00063HEAT_2/PF13646_6/98HEAT_2/PF13646_6/67HEAT_2/PF13646_6/18HEAT_2/PF13646_6/3_7e03BUD22/PF09073_10/5_9e03BUD22/PF09073_10/0_0014BUD22/PF09073_10/3_6e03SDA1/PF05285_12/0_17RNA_pol_3_Rpc31/PF11705_8/0_55DNA_pol_phi/PF04931_13/26DNA_pol_phi/PF04931
MSVDIVFGEGFTQLTWKEKLTKVSESRRTQLATSNEERLKTLKSLVDSSEGWTLRCWILRWLSVKPTRGPESDAVFYAAQNDRSAAIRALAAKYIATNSHFYSTDDMMALMDNMSTDSRLVMLQLLRRKKQIATIDRVLDRWRGQGECSHPRYSCFGSDEWVDKFLAESAEWLDHTTWVKLAKFHAAVTAKHLTRVLTSVDEGDPIAAAILEKSLQVLKAHKVDKEEMLKLVEIALVKFPATSTLKRVTRRIVPEVLERMSKVGKYAACTSLPNRLQRWLKAEVFIDHAKYDPKLLQHCPLDRVNKADWINQVYTQVCHLIDKDFAEWGLHERLKWASRLPRDRRYPLIERAIVLQPDCWQQALPLGSLEVACAKIQELIAEHEVAKGSRNVHHPAAPLLKDLCPRHRDQIGKLEDIIITLNDLGCSKNLLLNPYISLCKGQWTKERLLLLQKLYDEQEHRYYWYGNREVKPYWKALMEALPCDPEHVMQLIAVHMPDGEFCSLIPSQPAGNQYFEKIAVQRIDKMADSLRTRPWEMANCILALLDSGRKNAKRFSGSRIDYWPLVKKLLDTLRPDDLNQYCSDHLFKIMYQSAKDLLIDFVDKALAVNYLLLEQRVVCRYVMQERVDILAKFFESDMNITQHNHKRLVRLAYTPGLKELPEAWQLKYAERLLDGVLPKKKKVEQSTADESMAEETNAVHDHPADKMADGDDKESEDAEEDNDGDEKETGDNERGDDAEDDEDSEEGRAPYYGGGHFDASNLILLCELPAVSWNYLVKNVIEAAGGSQVPTWLARRGVYALAHVDDNRALEYLCSFAEKLDKDAVYSVTPWLAKAPPKMALEQLRKFIGRPVSVAKQVVRTIGVLRTKESQEELFKVFRDPNTHRHVKIAVIRGLWNQFLLKSTWDFLEKEAAVYPAWNVCRKITEITNWRLSLASRDCLMRIFGIMISRHEPKLTMAVLQRVSWGGPSTDCHELLEALLGCLANPRESGNKSTAMSQLMKLSKTLTDETSKLYTVLKEQPSLWLTDKGALDGAVRAKLMRQLITESEEEQDTTELTRRLTWCSELALLQDYILKYRADKLFKLELFRHYKHHQHCCLADFAELPDWLETTQGVCEDEIYRYMAVLLKHRRLPNAVPQIPLGQEQEDGLPRLSPAQEYLKKVLETSTDPAIRSYCKPLLEGVIDVKKPKRRPVKQRPPIRPHAVSAPNMRRGCYGYCQVNMADVTKTEYVPTMI